MQHYEDKTTSRHTTQIPLLAIAILCTIAQSALADDFTIAWWSIDGGGGMFCTGGDVALSGTLGQPDAGLEMTGGEFSIVGGFWTPSTPAFPTGDLGCDGVVDLFDIDPFVLALTSATEDPPFASYHALHPNCDPLLADINGDGSVNLFDIDAFVALLTGP
mgnify:CR=1 FL=1